MKINKKLDDINLEDYRIEPLDPDYDFLNSGIAAVQQDGGPLYFTLCIPRWKNRESYFYKLFQKIMNKKAYITNREKKYYSDGVCEGLFDSVHIKSFIEEKNLDNTNKM